ncbi:hypothetical protein IM792_10315 [Mucilaginibacter sp. JRF]|uniref:hypothetical protein n=1 Tax=Mucilaginibacter sp. JRF TaxID=2780088 RepID=UPI00187F8365|nr:hypothetical protein [Mucilaginibacter sp. JRF]MBE9584841.1 hypothetical protein [Mucilaginibacter sp. JRF]
MKWFAKLFLPLILILCCDSAFTANAFQDSPFFAQNTLQQDELLAKKLHLDLKHSKTLSHKHKPKRHNRAIAEELQDEGNETSFHKKQLDKNGLFAIFFNAHPIRGQLATTNTAILNSSYQVYHTYHNKLYRTLRVFRI